MANSSNLLVTWMAAWEELLVVHFFFLSWYIRAHGRIIAPVHLNPGYLMVWNNEVRGIGQTKPPPRELVHLCAFQYGILHVF